MRIVLAALSFFVCVLPWVTSSQAATRSMAVTAAVGVFAPTAYHAPISAFDRQPGPAASIGVAVPPGVRWFAPRVGVAVHSASADASRITTFRLDGGVVIGPPRPLGSVVPFLAADVGGYLGDYDRCGVPVLVDDGDLETSRCRGRRTGLGWQAGVGAVLRTRNGPAPLLEVRYVQSQRAADGVAVLVGVLW